MDGIPETLGEARGVRVFICNLMTQANESLGLSAAEHIQRIYEHTRRPVFDYAVVNTADILCRDAGALRGPGRDADCG